VVYMKTRLGPFSFRRVSGQVCCRLGSARNLNGI
jgi:hypothetical protein